MSLPLVSIVTPVYNGEKYLRHCLEGVLRQTYENFEYIILDNASTDNTAEIIEEFRAKDDRIRVFRNINTLKIIDNWNECIKYLSPESRWIKYAFADDYLFPNCVEEMVRVGEKSPTIGFVSSYRLNGRLLANAGLPMERDVVNGKDMLKMHILRRMHVCLDSPNTVLYKKSVFSELKGFDNNYLHADTELALRILNGYDLGFAHQVLTWTGVHADRGAAFAHFHGIITREYLKFAYKNIDRYDGIYFDSEEIKEVSRYYADEIARYIASHLVYFLWRDIASIWQEAPSAVKRQIWSVAMSNWSIYLRKFLGSLIHYRENAAERPTFKG